MEKYESPCNILRPVCLSDLSCFYHSVLTRRIGHLPTELDQFIQPEICEQFVHICAFGTEVLSQFIH